MTTPATSAPSSPVRIAGLDANRGLVLALMMGEALHFCGVAAAFPASALFYYFVKSSRGATKVMSSCSRLWTLDSRRAAASHSVAAEPRYGTGGLLPA